MSQKKKIIHRLRTTGSVDNFWSMNTKTSIRLGAIIFVLRKEGWEIKSLPLGKDKNQVYKLVSEPRSGVHTEAKEAFKKQEAEPLTLFGEATTPRRSTAYHRGY